MLVDLADAFADHAGQHRGASVVSGNCRQSVNSKTGAPSFSTRPHSAIVYGEYVILSINETRSEFFGGGVPRRIDFQLRLGHAGIETQKDAA